MKTINVLMKQDEMYKEKFATNETVSDLKSPIVNFLTAFNDLKTFNANREEQQKSEKRWAETF